MNTQSTPKKSCIDWPNVVLLFTLIPAFIFLVVVYAFITDMQPLVITVASFRIPVNAFLVPVILCSIGISLVIAADRKKYYWKPAITGFLMGLLYAGLGVVILLTKEPRWIWLVLLLNMIPDRLFSLWKKTKEYEKQSA